MTQKRWANFAGELLKQSEGDHRLTGPQMHLAVTAALQGEEPLVMAAEIVGLARNPKSKVEMSDVDAAKLLVQVHDRIYEMEARSSRETAEQFTMEFSWADNRSREEV